MKDIETINYFNLAILEKMARLDEKRIMDDPGNNYPPRVIYRGEETKKMDFDTYCFSSKWIKRFARKV